MWFFQKCFICQLFIMWFVQQKFIGQAFIMWFEKKNFIGEVFIMLWFFYRNVSLVRYWIKYHKNLDGHMVVRVILRFVYIYYSLSPFWVSEWVSEWLLLNANSAVFQLHVYHSENKLLFNEMMMMSALFKINTHSCIFIVLAHWNNHSWIDISSYSHTLSRFRANQSLSFLLNAAC
jgi:hypothetical protein